MTSQHTDVDNITLQYQDPGGQPSAARPVLSEQDDHSRLAAILQQDQDNLQQVDTTFT